jgi:NIMA (never in mitosis gene a)-related kinase
MSGRKIDEFVVQKRLGKGAFGEVFKVVRKSDGKTYALKKVSIAAMSHREILDALNEIRFLASIDHPNIVRFLEAFVNETSMELCIVQEFADGGDLASKVEQASKAGRFLDERLIWSYFTQMAEALAHLHKHNIVHRDIKPANCFLMLDGQLKLGDLNVSKLIKHGMVHTQIGTPYYMSPEIFRSMPCA